MSGDCDLCGSHDHVETRCPSTRLNDDFGCVRCGQVGCEWANGVGTQHRVIKFTHGPHAGCDRRITALEAEVAALRSVVRYAHVSFLGEWSTGLDEAAALDLDDECAAAVRRATEETP